MGVTRPVPLGSLHLTHLVVILSDDSSTFRPNPNSIPGAVVSRLSLYLRELQHLIADGKETTSSSQLGRRLGFTDAQVRKDLAHFGHFGHPGIGYRCDELITAIRKILGTDREWQVALVGVGNLGRALLGYRGFAQQGFRLVVAFDTDEEKVGTRIEGVEVCHLSRLGEVLLEKQIELGMVAVPAVDAQEVTDELVKSGVSGIVNFAPVTLKVPEGVSMVGVDLARELEQVTFTVANKLANPD
ncbi:redox-sensing transcriptional repressor Rex [Bythopirellula polymerisocia]|uniref:Redox-sensing transcriptional repressor Rex n=1 Tax=Bythopirellula polymerisocia TaxID=2528003 RepID=A0A5C6D147_9BACT|nr:redox-sensing transcriptional repressor Rex [Bythopirellula polymerisocia]TWU28609.1 Redox-sensing transcriptional repressor Rex [Bythopirellula polymerisocia]